jgi:hypothetical protein
VSKFDLHFESLPVSEVQGSRCLTFGNYKKSLGVRGIQKMVNRFTKCMLTPIGSDLSDPDYGTPLASAFLGNVDARTVHSLAVRSVTAAESKVREYDTEYEVPDTERLAQVRINGIYIDESGLGVLLDLTLKNAAGTAVQAMLTQIVE